MGLQIDETERDEGATLESEIVMIEALASAIEHRIGTPDELLGVFKAARGLSLLTTPEGNGSLPAAGDQSSGS